MTLTKQDIDGMVYRLWQKGWGRSDQDLTDLQRDAYLAAGLTAEGQRKPERVKCYLYRNAGQDDPRGITIGNPPQGSLKSNGWEVIPGWFVPDGAE